MDRRPFLADLRAVANEESIHLTHLWQGQRWVPRSANGTCPPMNLLQPVPVVEPLTKLIEALREELTQYGDMLALLDQQQGIVGHQGVAEILNGVTAIDIQTTIIQNARRQRETQQQQLARSFRRAEDCAFEELLPLLPEEYRPLLQALVEENQELLLRVQRRAAEPFSVSPLGGIDASLLHEGIASL